MPKQNLTELGVQRLTAASQTDFWDTGCAGLAIRVGPRSKTWVLKHQNRRITLGTYPSMGVREAREEARRRIAAPRRAISDLSFQEAAHDYLEHYCRPNNKPSTFQETRRLLKRMPFRGKLENITAHEVQRFIGKLPPGEANHCFSTLRALFNWCAPRGYIHTNPLQGHSKPHRTRSRERVLSIPELRTIWGQADAFGYPFGPLMQLLIVSGQRLNEITSMRRSWISKDTIVFPVEVVKNNAVHEIPLTPLLSELIEKLPAFNDLLFPDRTGTKPYAGHNKAMPRFRKCLPPDIPHFTCHDYRRTFSTLHASPEVGTLPHVTEALLNHRTGTRTPIQRVYDRHTYLPQMREAQHRYEVFLRTHILASANDVR